MRITMQIALIGALALGAGCGNEIGDSCSISTDCSPNGDRICDTKSPGGYCTIQGCDHDSCPDDSICVRFFTVTQTNLPCTTDAECTADEVCTLGGYCVPATSESRFCMKTCDALGDCRDDYECRDEALMIEHGGQPVLPPGAQQPDELPSFCAPAPVTF